MKRFIFPAILALVLHIFLLNLPVPGAIDQPVPVRKVRIRLTPKSAFHKDTKRSTESPRTVQPIPQFPEKRENKPVRSLIPKPFVSADPKPARPESPKTEKLKKTTAPLKLVDRIEPLPLPGKIAREPPEKIPVAVIPADFVPDAPSVEPAMQPKEPDPAEAIVAEPERTLPEPLTAVNADVPYPRKAKRRGFQGVTVLEVLVDAKGAARNVTIVQSSDHRILDQTAVTAVTQWRFKPGSENSVPVAMQVRVPVRFEIR